MTRKNQGCNESGESLKLKRYGHAMRIEEQHVGRRAIGTEVQKGEGRGEGLREDGWIV